MSSLHTGRIWRHTCGGPDVFQQGIHSQPWSRVTRGLGPRKQEVERVFGSVLDLLYEAADTTGRAPLDVRYIPHMVNHAAKGYMSAYASHVSLNMNSRVKKSVRMFLGQKVVQKSSTAVDTNKIVNHIIIR